MQTRILVIFTPGSIFYFLERKKNSRWWKENRPCKVRNKYDFAINKITILILFPASFLTRTGFWLLFFLHSRKFLCDFFFYFWLCLHMPGCWYDHMDTVPHSGQKMVSGFLELESLMFMNWQTQLVGTKLRSFARIISYLNNGPSLQTPIRFLLKINEELDRGLSQKKKHLSRKHKFLSLTPESMLKKSWMI